MPLADSALAGLAKIPSVARMALHVVHVHVRVKPESLEAFRAATLANARASLQEPGILRFDFLQQTDDATRFTLVEVYRHPAAQAAHRETAHYLAWRAAVEPMMAEPRVPVKYANVFPDDADAGW